jgi:Ran GTPase-activating protein (RanGAP) involved in mRNA processing and transport
MVDDELKKICLRLCEMSDLQALHLKLNDNLVSNNGLAFLGKFLEVVELESLEIFIRGNLYDDKGASYLVSQVCKHKTLKNLKISFWK